MSTKRIKIKFEANGDGTLECVGGSTFKCLGKKDLNYPVDLTVQSVVGTDKFENKFSNEFQVNMPWAVLIWGQRGIYIHGWEGEATVASYGGDTNGCIHLQSDNPANDAKAVYNWIDGRTRITIEYAWDSTKKE